jgi:hypothetical protein
MSANLRPAPIARAAAAAVMGGLGGGECKKHAPDVGSGLG